MLSYFDKNSSTQSACLLKTSYLHGMLDGDQFRRAFINMVRKDSGLKANPALHTAYDLDGALDRLADVVRKHLDLKTIYRALQLKR